MSVVRRGSAVSVAGVAVAGAVLLGGPAWAQEAPPDYDPAIAESGLPASDTGTVDVDPDTPVDDGSCTVVQDGTGGDDTTDDSTGSAEPDPGAVDETVPADDESAADAGAADDTAVDDTTTDDTAADDTAADDTAADGSDSTGEVVVCAAASGGAPEATGGGGGLEVDAAELPRTGSSDRLLALTAVGAGLVVAGAGATVAGRRRRA